MLRGEALRDAFILRLLAVERFVRGVLLIALAYGIYRFEGSKDALRQVFDAYLPLLRPLADRLGIDLQAAGPVRLIQQALNARQHTLVLVATGVLAYGALQLLEGVGLWLMRRWGEYVAVVGTSVFIPLEVYELVERVTWVRVAAMVVNVAAVAYLLWTKRLFGHPRRQGGVRGGAPRPVAARGRGGRDLASARHWRGDRGAADRRHFQRSEAGTNVERRGRRCRSAWGGRSSAPCPAPAPATGPASPGCGRSRTAR